MRPVGGGPIAVHLADGGHDIVDFEDPGAGDSPAGDGIISALIHAEGSERDLEQAIVAQARAGGFVASVSAAHHPTTVVIESGGSKAEF